MMPHFRKSLKKFALRFKHEANKTSLPPSSPSDEQVDPLEDHESEASSVPELEPEVNLYQYRELKQNSNEIRLLRLLHHPREDERTWKSQPEMIEWVELHGEMIHVDLDSAPPYRALSYTWGDVRPDHVEVYVDGQIFMARENLWLALNQLDYDKTIDLIWIDALCIDQRNVAERNEQVKKMKTIYERAEEVLVWLGPSINTFPEFQFVRKLYRRRNSIRRVTERIEAPDAPDLLRSLAKLFQRSYWFRMWIVQELTVARKIVLLCGHDSCSADVLSAVQALFQDMRYAEKFPNDVLFNRVPDPPVTAILRTNGIAGYDKWQQALSSNKLSFFECLMWHEFKSASDPKDMILGLAGLANTTSKYKIDVDYSLSVTQIYTNFARLEIDNSQSLNILTRARLCTNEYGLPSWVPHWSSPQNNGHFFLRNITQPQYYFCAAKETLAKAVFDERGEIMTVTSVQLGTVGHVGRLSGAVDIDDLDAVVSATLEWWAMLYGKSGADELNLEAFTRTIMGNRISEQDIGQNCTESEFLEAVMGSFADYLLQKNPEHIVDPVLEGCWTSRVNTRAQLAEENGWVFSLEDERIIWRSWLQTSANRSWNRRLFFFGNTMGLAPKDTLEGDIICVPLGCCHPMIFRQIDNHYIVVGEAYLHGYMYGKAIDMLENGELKLQQFELR